jgi:hypothetical protein
VAAIGVSRVLLRDTASATVLACAIVIGFFSYGHLYDGLKDLGQAEVVLIRHRYLVVSFALLVLSLAFLLVKNPGLGSVLVGWLTTFGWILVMFPLATIVVHQVQSSSTSGPQTEALPTTLESPRDPPDILYVVLDGYGRSDVLQSSYGVDNTPFLDALRSRGFFVADKAMSNYSRTLLSMAASLNMDYLEPLRAQNDPGRSGRRPYIELLQHNRVFMLFRALGYSIVAFATGFEPTEFKDVDLYLAPPGSNRPDFAEPDLTAFEGLLLQMTIAKVAIDFYPEALPERLPWLIDHGNDQHRERVLFTISNLSDVAAQPGNHFVFAHVVAPHPPFVFGPNGEELSPAGIFTFDDVCCQGTDYFKGYAGQLEYLNGLVMREIDEVLLATRGNVIIILQGDHGPAGLLDWEEPTSLAIHERMAILNAYYLPEPMSEGPYSSETPVNTFRMILDGYFGGRLGRLRDASYFSTPLGSEFTLVEPSP